MSGHFLNWSFRDVIITKVLLESKAKIKKYGDSLLLKFREKKFWEDSLVRAKERFIVRTKRVDLTLKLKVSGRAFVICIDLDEVR